jgi:hypothetical protein
VTESRAKSTPNSGIEREGSLADYRRAAVACDSMLALSDGALAYLAIAATAMPTNARGSWLERLAKRIEATSGIPKLSDTDGDPWHERRAARLSSERQNLRG